MKRILSLIAALAFCFAANAQIQEVALSDTVQGEIKTLRIESGWQVRLIQSDTPTVTIVIPEDKLPPAVTIHMTLSKKGRLNISRNTTMPFGTVLEIACDFAQISEIELGNNATITADNLVLANATIFLDKYAVFDIRNLCTKECCMTLSDFSRVQIDSLSGKDLTVELYEGVQFHFNQKHPETLLTINEQAHQYETYIPEGMYIDSCSSRIQHDTILNITVFKYQKPKMTLSVTVGIGAGYRNDYSPRSLGSPYYSFGTFHLYLPINADISLNSHWNLQSGLYFQMERKELAHQVNFSSNGLILADEVLPAQRNSIVNYRIGIPIAFYYNIFPSSKASTSIGFDLRFSRLLTSKMQTISLTDDNTVWHRNIQKEKIDICNPWRIEAGLSILSNQIGLIHGIRLFANLLPEYKDLTTGKGIRSFGFEFIF